MRRTSRAPWTRTLLGAAAALGLFVGPAGAAPAIPVSGKGAQPRSAPSTPASRAYAQAQQHFAAGMNAFLAQDYPGAVKALLQALSAMEEAVGPEHPDVAAVLVNLAESRRRMGAFEPAEADIRRALKLLEKVVGTEHPELSKPLISLGRTLLDTGRAKDAEQVFTRAITLARKGAPGDPMLVTLPQALLAAASVDSGRIDGGLDQLDSVLDAYEDALTSGTPTADVLQAYLAEDLAPFSSTLEALAREGKQRLAVPIHDRWEVVVTKVMGRASPVRVGALLSRADACFQLGRYGRAASDLEAAMGLLENAPAPLKALRGKLHLLQASVDLERGRFRNARESSRAARAATLSGAGSGEDAAAETDRALADLVDAGLALRCGDAAGAARLLDGAEPTLRANLPPVPLGSELKIQRAAIAVRRGKKKEARGLLEKAVGELSEHFAEGHPEVARARLHLARILAAAGEASAAAAAVISAQTALREALGEGNPLEGLVLAAKARVYEVRRQAKKAHAYYNQARKLLSAAGIRDPRLLRDHARLLHRVGKKAAAAKLLALARKGCEAGD